LSEYGLLYVCTEAWLWPDCALGSAY
jgi:hypothetical protein